MSKHMVVAIAPPGAGKTFFRIALARLCARADLRPGWELSLSPDTREIDREVWNDSYQRVTKGMEVVSTETIRAFHLNVGETGSPVSRTAILMDLPGSTFFRADGTESSVTLRTLLEEHARERDVEVSLVLFINQPHASTDPATSLDGPVRSPLQTFLESAKDRISRVVFYYAAADLLALKSRAHAPAPGTSDELLAVLRQNMLSGEARVHALGPHILPSRIEFMKSMVGFLGPAKYSVALSSAMGLAADGALNKAHRQARLRIPDEWTPLYVMETLLFCCDVETLYASSVHE